jgi:hypothetical protein
VVASIAEEEAGLNATELAIQRAVANAGQTMSKEAIRKAGARAVADKAASITRDIAVKVKQFSNKTITDQKRAYKKALEVFRDHLRKYKTTEEAAKPGSEVDRLRRELQQFRNILRERGQQFGPEGDLIE